MDLLEGKIKKQHPSVVVAPIHVPKAITASAKALKKHDSYMTPMQHHNAVNQVNMASPAPIDKRSDPRYVDIDAAIQEYQTTSTHLNMIMMGGGNTSSPSITSYQREKTY